MIQTKTEPLFWPLILTACGMNGRGGVSWHMDGICMFAFVASLSYRQFNMRFRLFHRPLLWCILQFTARAPSLCGTSTLGVTSQCSSTHKINTLCVAASYSHIAPLKNSWHKDLWLNKRKEFTLKIGGWNQNHMTIGSIFFCWWYTSVLNQNSMRYLPQFSREYLNHIDNVALRYIAFSISSSPQPMSLLKCIGHHYILSRLSVAENVEAFFL